MFLVSWKRYARAASCIAHKMKFPNKDFFSKFDQICSFLGTKSWEIFNGKLHCLCNDERTSSISSTSHTLINLFFPNVEGGNKVILLFKINLGVGRICLNDVMYGKVTHFKVFLAFSRDMKMKYWAEMG